MSLASICILRLSALGDATHMVPMVRRLQAAHPQARITWIIGKLEAKLVGDLAGVEFIPFDKKAGWAGLTALRGQLAGRRFDVLLQCQLALRASLMSTLIRADRRIGYDRARSREGHSLFIDERIAPTGFHVLDVLGEFAGALGAPPAPPQWDIAVSDWDRTVAADLLPGDQPTLLLSPASSHTLRNWSADRYAAVADHAVRRHGLRVALCGGRSALERELADAIATRMATPPLDLVGRDTLKQFLALCQRSFALLTPDSGPMHMANTVGTPVLGLHAATDSRRSGPYSDLRWTVDRFAEAARKYLRKSTDELRWGTRIEYPGVMDLIAVDDVVERLDALVAARLDGESDRAQGPGPRAQ